MTRSKPDLTYSLGKILFNIPATSLLAAFMLLGASALPKLSLPICIVAFLFSGYDIIISAVQSCIHKRFLNSDVFVLLACLGTFLFGFWMEGAIGMLVYSACQSILSAEDEDIQLTEAYSSILPDYQEDREDYLRLTDERSAPLERSIKQFGLIFSLVCLLIILILTVFVPLIWRLTYPIWLRRAFMLLAASCPGAVGYTVAIEYDRCRNRSASAGIFFKNRAAIQNCGKVTSLVFSHFQPVPAGWHLVNCVPQGISKGELIRLAAYASAHASSCYADIIQKETGILIDEDHIQGYSQLDNLGCAVILDGHKIAAGSSELMQALRIEIPPMRTAASVQHVAADGNYVGCLLFSESVQPVEADAIARLTEMGMDRIVLLSTEDKTLTEETARRLSIHEVFAGLSPEEAIDRMTHLQQMQLSGELLAYINDGYSACDLMQKADLRISVGSDPTVSRADVIIPEEDYGAIATALQNCRIARQSVRSNLILVGILKALGILAAVAGWGGIWLIILLDTIASMLILPGFIASHISKKQKLN